MSLDLQQVRILLNLQFLVVFILLLTVIYKFRFKLVWCKDKDEELKVVSELRSFCALNLDGQEKEK